MNSDPVEAKRLLRRRALGRRLRMSEADWRRKSDAIVHRLLEDPQILAAESVALFWPMSERREVDLRGLDTSLRALEKSLHYPFMTSIHAGGFRHANAPSDLRPSAWGFMEPGPECPTSGPLDVIVAPALLVTANGERLGYGAGFYDRMLSREVFANSISVAVAFAEDVVNQLPTGKFDQRCRRVVTG